MYYCVIIAVYFSYELHTTNSYRQEPHKVTKGTLHNKKLYSRQILLMLFLCPKFEISNEMGESVEHKIDRLNEGIIQEIKYHNDLSIINLLHH